MNYYRKCFVPTCPNDSTNSPNKMFVRIREDMREKWCREAKTEYFKIYTQYCCEDHFDPEVDLKNYFKHKLMQAEPVFKPTAKLRCKDSLISQETKAKESPELYSLLKDKMTLGRKRKYGETVSSYSIPSTSMSTKDRHASQLATPVSEPGPSDEIEVKAEMPDELPDPLDSPGHDDEVMRDANEQISVSLPIDADIKEELQSDEDDTEHRAYEKIISKLKEEMAELKSENQRLADENRRLMDENRTLVAENRIAAEKSRNLTSGIEQLLQKSENQMKDYEHVCKLSDLKKIEAENKRYKEEIDRLNKTICAMKSESRKRAVSTVHLTEQNQRLKDKTEQLQGKIKKMLASNKNVPVLKELRSKIEQLEKENRQLTIQIETLRISNERVVEQIEVSEEMLGNTGETLERVKKPTVMRGRRKRKRL